MVLELVDDILEATQNAVLATFGSVFDVLFNPAAALSEGAVWIVAALLAYFYFYA